MMLRFQQCCQRHVQYKRLIAATLCYASLVCTAATAASLEELLENDQLRLRSWLQPEADIVVGEEVRLTIEVATRRWFAGGTRIRPPEIRNLVVLRRDQFATNQSRREGETTWVIQQWNLELYPQAEGVFSVPPIQLELAVNDATEGVVRGSLLTSPLTFEAGLPAALQGLERWLATPEFTVQNNLDREPTELRPGDAIVREVVLRATHVTAMMLPAVHTNAIDGLSAYPDLPQLEDRSNRGEATAERRERITYVVEQSGEYQLPEQVFYWWDTRSGQLREAVLPALTFEAGVGQAGNTQPQTGSSTAALNWRRGLNWGLLLAALILVVTGLRRLPQRNRAPAEWQQLRRINRALSRGDQAMAAKFLYGWLNTEQPQPDWLRLRRALARDLDATAMARLEALLENVFREQGTREPARLKVQRPGWLQRQRHKLARHREPVALPLNPGSSAGE
jgi:hypothetical protein